MTDERRPGHPEQEHDPEASLLTEQDPQAAVADETAEALPAEPSSATVISPPREAEPWPPPHAPDLSVLDVRPQPGPPREYHFPAFERTRLANGLTVISAHMPGRALLAANLVLLGGGAAEPPELAGVTMLTGRALTEGTQRRDAIAFVEAAERLGAELHADTSWEALTATLEVPRSRFGPALALLAEMVREPAFPADEVARLRDERLNDLKQARADPRRRAERVFPEAIYDASSAYRRPLGGVEATVGLVDREQVLERHAAAADPSRATLIVAGDLG
ncbi:MAG: insulinase family protein, partial [Chloroflexota bacterium]|nr:insulinase family protein [Chloroflexota bacterium]